MKKNQKKTQLCVRNIGVNGNKKIAHEAGLNTVWSPADKLNESTLPLYSLFLFSRRGVHSSLPYKCSDAAFLNFNREKHFPKEKIKPTL